MLKLISSGRFTTKLPFTLPLSSYVLIIVSWVSISELLVDFKIAYIPFRLFELLLK